MNKRAIYINVILFIISILLLSLIIYQQIDGGYLSITETLAMALLSLSFILKKYNFIKGQWLLFGLLVILLLQIIDFSYSIQNGNETITYHTSKFTDISINPIVLIILFAFGVVNWRIFGLLFYGSEKEREENFNKKVSFYYHKFKDESNEELEYFLSIYKEYPKEAQVALTKIKKEKSED
jgi:hypothetical protein